MELSSNQQSWELYVQGLTSTDQQKRKALLEKTVSSDCLYTGPSGQVRGLGNLETLFDGFRDEYPNAKFQTLRFVEHSGRALVEWDVVGQEGGVLVSGTTFSCWGDDGRINDMTGFYYTRE